MTSPADVVLTNGRVHTLAPTGDETYEAVAVRDGEVVRVASAYDVDFLVGAETDVIDLDGRVVLPGFVDAHTHMEQLGQYQVHADLSAAESLADAQDRLRARAGETDDWVVGFGYDESEWADAEDYPTRADLDAVSEDRPVVAVRVDMHTASVNSVALDALRDELPVEDVETVGGEPTGVVVEDAAEVVWDVVEPDRGETRELLLAAQSYAHEHGVTAVHDMVRNSHAPRVYRDLDYEGELALRVRLNYWSDHLDAVVETGLRPNHGSDFVEVGAIKTFTDGSMGSRTARLFESYADGEGRGQWVVDPDDLRELVSRADAHDLQVTAHAIGDEAVEVVLDAFATVEDPAGARHRVEHAEVLTDEQVERFGELGVIASCQPNFLQWAQPGGLYDQRVGVDRRRRCDRFRDLLDAGSRLAFSSDVMPMDPMLGVHLTVNAPVDGQQLSVTEALRAYTHGGAYAGFAEDRMGTVAVGSVADFVVLEDDPWAVDPGDLRDVEVAMTVVDGDVVYDDR
jgi:hypothetical protein